MEEKIIMQDGQKQSPYSARPLILVMDQGSAAIPSLIKSNNLDVNARKL